MEKKLVDSVKVGRDTTQGKKKDERPQKEWNKIVCIFSSPNILNIDYLLKIVMDYYWTVSGVSVESQEICTTKVFDIWNYNVYILQNRKWAKCWL